MSIWRMHCSHWLALSYVSAWAPMATFLATCRRNRDVFLPYTLGLWSLFWSRLMCLINHAAIWLSIILWYFRESTTQRPFCSRRSISLYFLEPREPTRSSAWHSVIPERNCRTVCRMSSESWHHPKSAKYFKPVLYDSFSLHTSWAGIHNVNT